MFDRRSTSGRFVIWLRALRVVHWVKNLVVMLPVVLGTAVSPREIAGLCGSVLTISAAASACYLVNDLHDIESDKLDLTRRDRPIASGRLSQVAAIQAAYFIGGAAVIGGFLQSAGLGLVVSAFIVVNLVYTYMFRKRRFVDVLLISALFSLRALSAVIIVGGATSWALILYTGLVAISLTITKRIAELERTGEPRSNLDYQIGDLPLMKVIGAAAAISAGCVLVNYQVGRGLLVLLKTGAIGAVTASWLLSLQRIAYTGRLSGDPVQFVLTSKATWMHVASAGILVLVLISNNVVGQMVR